MSGTVPNNDAPRIASAKLTDFCQRIFERLGVSAEDARITAEILVAADLRGIDSHGVARLRLYVTGLQNGMMLPRPAEKVITETPVTALLDAGAGLGQPISYRAMTKAIEKAKAVGAGFVTVRNSNHYGIAGYYSMMALEHDMIGMSTTNAGVLVIPTFGRDARLGTNPISVAVPAGNERPYVLDMATSTVPRGKLEVYNRLEKPLPIGWATDEHGVDTTDAARVLDNFKTRAGGGLLPLGGAGELLSGHKGYGLGLLVEILSGVLPGAAFSLNVYPQTADGKPLPSALGHFFGAWRIDAFRPVDEFKADMDELTCTMKETPKAAGAERIYIHGEKEYEQADERRANGLPIHRKIVADMRAIAEELGVEYNL